MKKLTYLFLFCFVAIVAIGNALADDPPPFDGTSPDSIPVDGGASLLVAGGIAYGAKKLRLRSASKKA